MPAEASDVAYDAWSATIAAAILRRGSMVHAASLILTFAALLGCTAASVFVAGPDFGWLRFGVAIVILGLGEFWLAARVALDADLFDAIAAKTADLDGFDRAMQGLGLMPQHKAKRTLSTRIRAAFRLLKLQGLAFGLQVAVLVIGTLAA
jgi:hypothetical protein